MWEDVWVATVKGRTEWVGIVGAESRSKARYAAWVQWKDVVPSRLIDWAVRRPTAEQMHVMTSNDRVSTWVMDLQPNDKGYRNRFRGLRRA